MIMRYKCNIEIEKSAQLTMQQRKYYKNVINDVMRVAVLAELSPNISLFCLAQKLEGIEVDIRLTDDEDIQNLNSLYRGIDRATDVLSFPDHDLVNGRGKIYSDCIDPKTNYLSIGNIAISIPRCLAQAKDYGHSVERELAFLYCHGLLHLNGYDHMEKEQEKHMNAICEDILTKAGYKREEA